MSRAAVARSGKGMTFIELLVVIVVITALAGIVVPRLKRRFDDFALVNFSKDIYYLIRYLQGEAAGQRRFYRLEINSAEGSFRALERQGSEFSEIKGRFGRVYQAPAGVGVAVEPQEKSWVLFYPDASIDGQIKLTFSAKDCEPITFEIKGLASEIQVE